MKYNKGIGVIGIIFIIVGILVVETNVVSASVNPVYKECIQRNYQIESANNNIDGIEYCVFPDNTKCSIETFNSGSCGEEFMTQNYCTKEGIMVWDKDMCCVGLKSYIPIGMIGQPTCQPIIKSIGPLLYLGGGLILGLFVYFLSKKKNNKIIED